MTSISQFIYRFTKLQHSMARRLLPSLYQHLEADTEPRPFLDLLHRLEQLDIVPSVARWLARSCGDVPKSPVSVRAGRG